MNAILRYLDKQIGAKPLISENPRENLSLIITIPCFNEPNILKTLKSIDANIDFVGSVEVLILINQPSDCKSSIDQQNTKTLEEIREWLIQKAKTNISYYPIRKIFHTKKAGVGLARKIAMDEAVRRYSLIEKPEGIITGLDADSIVQNQYCKSIINHFGSNPKPGAVSIHFEHPISGTDFKGEVYEAILSYELHLRYYIYMQRMLNLPFAFQTIGSSMAVRAITYAQVGGMNKRQAGEDFYFLHKCIKHGEFSEINDSTVIPSPRISNRVPFGTGKAVGEMIEKQQSTYYTYNPRSFEELSAFVFNVSKFFKEGLNLDRSELHQGVKTFLRDIRAEDSIIEISKNTSQAKAFEKRFFQAFDAFFLMKYLHYMREHYYPDVPVLESCNKVVKDANWKDSLTALIYFRNEHLSRNYGESSKKR